MKEEMDFELVCEPEEAYKLNSELSLAWRMVEETGANLFLTGRAGTGKTTFLKRLREQSDKRMIVLAPTGVAAINAGGNTIHSFFQLPFSPYIPGKGFIGEDKRLFKFSKEKRRIISSLSLIVIDEISMVRPDILDGLDSVLRRLKNPMLPFGGTQLLLIGDLRQLPPVVRENEWELLAPHYASPYFFESKALKEAGFQTIALTTIFRQTDRDFIKILNAIRDGNADKDILDALNARYLPGFNPPDNEGFIRLTTHNRIADNFNARKMEALEGTPVVFEAEIEGDFPESMYPIEKTLELKEGAQVMFIKNDTGADRQYYNGLLGEVVSITDEFVGIKPLDSDRLIQVTPVEWENTRYNIDDESKDITQHTVGIFRQLPLRPAWAITIHKSQGLTFDKAIINATYSFAAGQTYVALSRCRSLEGLVLDSPISAHAVITDADVNSFVEYCETHSPDETTLNNLRSEYLRMLLAELFDFNELRIAFTDFHRYASEFILPLRPKLEYPLTAFMSSVYNEIDAVGRKFINLYASRPIDPDSFSQNEPLLEKIRSGCRYFLDHLRDLNEFVSGVPIETENQSYNQRLNSVYERLTFVLALKISLMKALSSLPFSAENYVNTKARIMVDLVKGEARKKKKEKKKPVVIKPGANLSEIADLPNKEKEEKQVRKPESKKEKEPKPKKKKKSKPKGYSAFLSHNMFKEGKNIEQIAEERNLAQSTIAGHLADMVKLERMTLEEAIPGDYLKVLSETAPAEAIKSGAESNFPIQTWKDFKEAIDSCGREIPRYYASLYWHALKP